MLFLVHGHPRSGVQPLQWVAFISSKYQPSSGSNSASSRTITKIPVFGDITIVYYAWLDDWHEWWGWVEYRAFNKSTSCIANAPANPEFFQDGMVIGGLVVGRCCENSTQIIADVPQLNETTIDVSLVLLSDLSVLYL
ncbi:hypothetical protein PTI98_001669 [Pleurotus ostreatus]|nr:hypothetical protein PTI98_001669 [Pleurotus ostreatus]